MRKSIFDPCTRCPALTERDNKPFCIFFEEEVEPEEDGCRYQFVNRDEVLTELLVIKDSKRW